MTNYRLLNDGEVIEKGDEFYDAPHWYKIIVAGSKQGCDSFIRRRPISVGTWIPTAERLPEPPNRNVIVQHHSDSKRYVFRSESVNPPDHVAWQEMPEPYVPPKPKRGEVLFKDGNKYCQVLPGDPDPDVTLEVLEEWRRGISGLQRSLELFSRIEESRSK